MALALLSVLPAAGSAAAGSDRSAGKRSGLDLPLRGVGSPAARSDRSASGEARDKKSKIDCSATERRELTAPEWEDELAHVSKNPRIETYQFQTAIQYFQQAIRRSREVPPERANEVAQLIYAGYVLVRRAHAGMDSRIVRMKSPDLELKWKYKTILGARGQILAAQALTNRACVKPDDLTKAAEHLNEGVGILQRVLELGV